MSLCAKLSRKPEPPAYAEILNQFPAASVADHLGITYSYVKMILSGNRRPGQALERRLVALSAQVTSEKEQ